MHSRPFGISGPPVQREPNSAAMAGVPSAVPAKEVEISDCAQPSSSDGHFARATFLKLLPYLLLLLMALLAGGSAWRESATVDEVVHIGAGLSYLQKFDLRLNPEHPPLAKLIAGLPLLLEGIRADYSNTSWRISSDPGPADLAQWIFGNWVLYQWNNPQSTLALARLPMLICTVVLGWLIWAYATRLGGRWGGVLCLAVYVSTPLFLAFGPLVLTDTLVTLFSLLTLWCTANLWDRPGRGNVVRFALTLAGALLSKFTSGLLLFVMPALALTSHWRPLAQQPGSEAEARVWRRVRWRAMAGGIIAAAALAYVFYLVFSWNQPTGAESPQEGIVAALLGRALMPLGIYGHGVSAFLASAKRPTFLLGRFYSSGIWFYFPILFVLKSSVGFICLLILTLMASLIVSSKEGRPAEPHSAVISSDLATHWRVIWVSLTIFTAACLFSPLDISFRHFSMPVVLFILLLAALPAKLSRLKAVAPRAASIMAVTAILLAASCILSALWTYPYYIPYVNVLSGGTPIYMIFNDSNVDWNQALPEVNRFANRLGLQEIAVDAFGFTDPAVAVPRSRFWNCQRPTSQDEGKWVAVSANMIFDTHNCAWLLQYPQEALGGGSMIAFHLPDHIPPPGSAGGPPASDETREIFGLRTDIRVLLLTLTRDPRKFTDFAAGPGQLSHNPSPGN